MSDQPFDPLNPFGTLPPEEEGQGFDPSNPFGSLPPIDPATFPLSGPLPPPPTSPQFPLTTAPEAEDFIQEFPQTMAPGPEASSVVAPGELDPRFLQLRDLGIEAQGLVATLGPADSEVTRLRDQIAQLQRELINDYPALTQADFDRMSSDPLGLGRRIGNLVTPGLLHASDILEPVQIPWQLAMRAFQAQLESADRGDNIWQTLRNMGDVVNDVQYDLAFDRYRNIRTFFTGRTAAAEGGGGRVAEEGQPSTQLMSDIVTYRDILEQVGVTNELALKTFGVAGDLLIDPLNAAPFVGGFKRIAQGLGATRAADALQTFQNGVEALTTPMGVIRTARSGARAVPGGASLVDFTEGIAERLLRSVLDAEFIRTTTPNRAGVSLGSFLQPRSDRIPGGLGDELIRTERAADLSAEELVDFINDRFEAIENTLGRDRTRRWLGSQFDSMHRARVTGTMMTHYEQELQDLLMTALVDTADNTGALARPGALELAEGMLVRESAQLREGPLGITQVGTNVGEELQQLRGLMPGHTNLVHSQYTERLAEMATRLGRDPNEVLRVFEDMLDNVVAADAVAGWHQSLYPQMKELFWERAFQAGASADQASELWLRSWETVLRGGSLDEVIFEIPNGVARATPIPHSEVRGGVVVTDVGRLLSLPNNIAQLPFEDYMRALGQGHLRRTFGTVVSPDQFSAFTRAAEAGVVSTSRIMDDAISVQAVRQSIGADVADLLQDYIDNISPNNPGERGFLLRQDRMIQHLVDNGVAPARAHAAMGRIIAEANPHLEDWARRVTEMFADREVQDVGRTGPFTGRAAVSQRNLELTADQLDELGRMFDAGTSMRETAIVAAGQYSQNRFVHDVWRTLNESGQVFPRSTRSVPRGYVVMPDAPGVYGQLAGQYVPRWAQRELFNATRSQTPNGFLVTYARIRSAITGSILADPTTNMANFAGGLITATQHGFNPATLLDEMIQVVIESRGGALRTQAGQAAREGVAPGLQGLPEFREMGELLSTTGLAGSSQFGRTGSSAKLQRLIDGVDLTTPEGMRAGINAMVRTIQDEGAQFLSNPARVGPLGRRLPPGMTNVVGGLGLDGFEYIENIFKMAAYRVRRAQGATQSQAYRDARLVVFDYADIPQALEVFRATGVPPFASFPAFASARVLRTALERPGVVSVTDRLADTIWQNIIPDEEVRNAYFNTLEEWQRNGRYIPVRFRVGATGSERDVASMFPLDEMIVSAPWAGNPLVEGATSFGINRWVVDLATAYSGGLGEAGLGQFFGERVFEADADASTRARQTGEFMFNNLAPRFVRRFFNFGGPGQENEGIIPELFRFNQAPRVDVETAQALDQIRALEQGREERDLWESTFSSLLRTAHPISLDAATNPVVRDLSLQGFEDQEMRRTILSRVRAIQLSDLPPAEKQQALIDAYSPVIQLRVQDVARLVVVLEGMERLRETE